MLKVVDEELNWDEILVKFNKEIKIEIGKAIDLENSGVNIKGLIL